MLVAAINYADELIQLTNGLWFTEKYMYWNADAYYQKIQISEDSWNKHQFVSVADGNVIGFISYTIDRAADSVTNLSIANFTEDSVTFGRDVYRALSDIFLKFNFRKLSYSVVVGNPIEKQYDKLTKKFHGRIVGTEKSHFKLIDNKFYDYKSYEIFRNDFLEAVNER